MRRPCLQEPRERGGPRECDTAVEDRRGRAEAPAARKREGQHRAREDVAEDVLHELDGQVMELAVYTD